MKPTRRALLCSIVAISTSGAWAFGCARPATRPPAAPRAEPRALFESSVPAAPAASSAQRRAQQSWCAYLEALYRRAMGDGARWRQAEECNADASSAAPEMLERTAACAQRALEGFDGDPFTPEYAAEVKQCGTTVLDALALAPADVEPYVALVCQRDPSCGQEPPGCRSEVTARFGARLGRALGALNAESRVTVRQCLEASICQDADARISGCIEPVLDRLLWTPG
jgi:hypothetical protein